MITDSRFRLLACSCLLLFIITANATGAGVGNPRNYVKRDRASAGSGGGVRGHVVVISEDYLQGGRVAVLRPELLSDAEKPILELPQDVMDDASLKLITALDHQFQIEVDTPNGVQRNSDDRRTREEWNSISRYVIETADSKPQDRQARLRTLLKSLPGSMPSTHNYYLQSWRASLWEAAGDAGNAAKQLRALAKDSATTTVRLLKRIARLDIIDQNLSSAVVMLRSALQKEPDDVDAWLLLAVAEMRAGRRESSVTALGELELRDSSVVSAQLLHALILEEQRDWRGAETFYGRALDMALKDPLISPVVVASCKSGRDRVMLKARRENTGN